MGHHNYYEKKFKEKFKDKLLLDREYRGVLEFLEKSNVIPLSSKFEMSGTSPLALDSDSYLWGCVVVDLLRLYNRGKNYDQHILNIKLKSSSKNNLERKVGMLKKKFSKLRLITT